MYALLRSVAASAMNGFERVIGIPNTGGGNVSPLALLVLFAIVYFVSVLSARRKRELFLRNKLGVDMRTMGLVATIYISSAETSSSSTRRTSCLFSCRTGAASAKPATSECMRKT